MNTKRKNAAKAEPRGAPAPLPSGRARNRPRVQPLAPLAPFECEAPPLPPYMREHTNEKTGVTHFRCDVSTRMRRAGFPLPNLHLGTEVHRALAIYDAQFAPVLQAWKESAATIALDYGPVHGSLEWWHEEYKKTERYCALADATKAEYDKCIRRSCKYVIVNGRFAGQRFGGIPLKWISEPDADELYAEYVIKVSIDDEGRKIEGRRSRTAQSDFQTLRAMVNSLMRKYRNLLHNKTNPFEGMFMPHRPVSPPPVVHPWLARFVRTADRKGLLSVSAIALFAWELEARVTHFPHKMTVDQFRGPNYEDQVFVDSTKNHEKGWFYLEDDDGNLMYPKLTKRLTKLKGSRTEGPMFPSERADSRRPWTIVELRAVVKEICKDAGLPSLNLSQFRKGGLAEAGAAGLTPAQITSQSMHKDYSVVHRHYSDRNAEVAMSGQQMRLGYRGRKAKRGVDIVT